MADLSAFIPGSPPQAAQPLARYLPPIPEGIATAWLTNHLQPGSWILDPFGASPHLVVEAARAGYRVLVAANNPVSRVLIESAARPPAEADLRAALADLGAASKGNERMEAHITGLYTTICGRCGRQVSANAFLWERNAVGPYARIYHCTNCGDSGEHPCTEEDIEKAAGFAAGGMHRARALERVVPLNDPDRPHVEEALSVYLPRAVYALFNLINKLDGLLLAPIRRSALQALLLTACDQANTLWIHPNTRERPKQLSTPHHFRENNVWLALEQGISLWAQPGRQVPLTIWPEQPPLEGGISLYEGRLRDLAASLSTIDVQAVLTALPRPNQAFWTLSALWAGWLWGKEAVGPFKSVLRRRRYDWGWHATALSAAFSSLSPQIQEGTPMFGLIGEVEPGFLTAAVTSADAAGFELDGIALRKDHELAQIFWRTSKPQPIERIQVSASEKAAVRGCTDLLRRRGQPSGYLRLQAGALQQMAAERVLQLTIPSVQTDPSDPSLEPSPSQNYSLIQAAVKNAFSPRSGLVRLTTEKQPGSDKISLETGLWWLKDETGSQRSSPLSDRVEIELVRYLLRNPYSTTEEIDGFICKQFPGLLTPDWELVSVCLESYAKQDLTENKKWQLREREAPSARRQDMETARELLTQIGKQLGFDVTQDVANPTAPTPGSTMLIWSEGPQARYGFTILASAALSEPIFSTKYPPRPGWKPIIVLPGSRANLVSYKLRTDPLLKSQVEAGWLFVKYRLLRQLYENHSLTKINFNEQITLDPLTYSAPQIRML